MTNHQTHLRIKPETLQRDHPRQRIPSSERPLLLVVEDDASLRASILDILDIADYDTVSAANGMDALHKLQEMDRTPDLIVSDIMMPKMNGYEFFDAVRSEGKWLSIPFVFLTAIDNKSDVQMAKAMGADDYITKPFDADDLIHIIKGKLTRAVEINSTLISQVSEMKHTILTILNHEFRTPLTYIVAYADMLKHSGEMMNPDEVLKYLGGVSSGADRLRDLVENFIYLVEVETGEAKTAFDLRKQPFRNFENLIDAALKPIESRIEDRRQTVEIDVESDLPAIVGDKEYLTIALTRLIDNASKFSDRQSTIDVSVYLNEAEKVVLSVSDQGRGIPEHELSKIFEPFYQVNREHFEDQGVGSGLAIVHGVAQLHNAEIIVATTEDVGSVFSMHFEPIG